jgi:hypothetical protein
VSGRNKNTSGFQGGGGDRSWLTPLAPDSTRQEDDYAGFQVIGTHTGRHADLNVPNPQPGFVYIHERATRPDIRNAKMRGGHVVQAEDPEFVSAAAWESTDKATPLDTASVRDDVVLVRYSEESIRRVRDEEQRLAQEQMRGGAEDFASRVTAMEQHMSRGLPTRFKGREHRMDFVDGKDQVVDTWTPDRGIIDEY